MKNYLINLGFVAALITITITAPVALAVSTPPSGITLAPFYKENTSYTILARPGRISHFVHIDLNPTSGFAKGAGYRFQYSLGMTQVDLGTQYLRGGLRNFSPEPSYTDGSNSFLDQNHSATSPWSLATAELGFSVRGRIFPYAERDWIQYARVSVGYGALKDETANSNYPGYIFGVEAGLQRAMNSRFSYAPYLAWRFGSLASVPLSSIVLGVGIGFGG